MGSLYHAVIYIDVDKDYGFFLYVMYLAYNKDFMKFDDD